MKIRILILALSLLSACEHQTSIRQNPDFANKWSKPYSVAVLPPEAHITYITFDSDDKRLTDQETKAINVINTEMPKLLADKNYAYHPLNVATYESAHPDAAFQLERVRQGTKKAMDELYKTSLMAEKDAFNIHKSVGSDVNLFADLAKADLLLYIDYQGFEKSDAMVAKDVAATVLFAALTGSAYVSPSEAGAVSAALIDGTTGDILWTNKTLTRSPVNDYDLTKDKDAASRADSPLGRVFEQLPDKSGPKPHDK